MVLKILVLEAPELTAGSFIVSGKEKKMQDRMSPSSLGHSVYLFYFQLVICSITFL